MIIPSRWILGGTGWTTRHNHRNNNTFKRKYESGAIERRGSLCDGEEAGKKIGKSGEKVELYMYVLVLLVAVDDPATRHPRHSSGVRE